jgi:hypothetical protein
VEERRGAVRVLATALTRAAVALALVAGTILVAGVPRARAEAPCDGAPGFEPRGRAAGDGAAVVFRTVPPVIAIGAHFALEAVVCAGATPAQLTRVDARMPEHRHGMNYRPTLAAKGPGHYVAEGFLFHMPGRWQLVFDVDAGGRRTRLTSDVQVE